MPTTAIQKIRLQKDAYAPWLIFGLLVFLLLSACSNKPDTVPSGDIVTSNQAKIEVIEDGFYQITAEDLADAGIEFESFSADKLALTTQNEVVPFYFAEDSLIFYGQAPTSRYTTVRPYVLAVGDDGVLMTETAVSPPTTDAPLTSITSKRHLEENHLYESQARIFNEDDVWFWDNLRQGNTLPIEFELPAVGDGSGAMNMQLLGVSHNMEIQNDHDFDVLINDIPIGMVQFDGPNIYTATLDIPTGTLQQGNNEIILDNSPEGANFLDIMQLNWLELTYDAPTTAVNDQLILQPASGNITLTGFTDTPLLFNISDPSSPQYLTQANREKGEATLALTEEMKVAAIGAKGFTPPASISPLREGNWRNSDHQADLIILTTDELAPALAPLVEAREAEGLGVAVVPVADIYDEFGGGEASPNSLKQFLSYAYANWQTPQPRYLLLVGDATSDYHDNLGLLPQNMVPAPIVPVTYSGETISDSILADTDGDGVPNMAVGRWPVNSADEVASLVKRTLAYEQGTAVDNVLFAADGTEAQFAQVANAIVNNSNLAEDGVQVLTGPQAADVTTILNDGAWLATYIGHGSLRQWGKEDVFTQEAITDLNLETPPIVLQFTCLTGLFTQPEQTSLTELLLTHETGPVLSVAATSLTLSSSQEPFATTLIQNLNDPNVERMGDAFQTAKLSLDIENSGLREISDTFALFGDPSARIVRPES